MEVSRGTKGNEDSEGEVADNSPHASPSPTSRQKWSLTQEAFDKLLASLAPDRGAAGEIYQETRDKLIRFFEWRGCQFPEDHADETINRVAKRVSEGEQISKLAHYFYGVARLLLLEIQKARARELHAFDNLPAAAIDSDNSGGARLDCLRTCLDAISSDQRELIISYYQGEKTIKIKNRQKLSKTLQVSLNTLRMRALRLRDSLETCVENCLNKTP